MVDQADDPFGSRAGERGPAWALVVVGLALLIGGIVLTIMGILGAVDAAGGIEDDAVGRASVHTEEVRNVVRFTVPDGDRRDYTVWVLFDGIESNDDIRELMARDTGCAVDLPDGAETRFRGARQDTSTVLGDAASVGHFSSQAGLVQVRCAYITGSFRSRRTRFEGLPYVVSPGTPGEAGTSALVIVGGVFAAIAGGFLAGWGWSRRRRHVR